MEVLYPRCGGRDVPKASVTACGRWLDHAGRSHHEIRRFGTYRSELRQLGDWLPQSCVPFNATPRFFTWKHPPSNQHPIMKCNMAMKSRRQTPKTRVSALRIRNFGVPGLQMRRLRATVAQ